MVYAPQDTWTNFTTTLLNGDKNSNYNISIASLYNTPIEDKKNYVDGNNSGFVNSTGVFGRRYYINGNTGDQAFILRLVIETVLMDRSVMLVPVHVHGHHPRQC